MRFLIFILYVFVLSLSLIITIVSDKKIMAGQQKYSEDLYYEASLNPDHYLKELAPEHGDIALNKEGLASYNLVSSPMRSGPDYPSVSAAPNPVPDGHDIIETFIYSYRPYAIFLSMIVGMFCFQLYNTLQRYAKNGKIVPLLKVFIESALGAKFLMAVVVSPIVFMAIRSLFAGVQDTSACCFISFQNGFFWITVFNSIPKQAMICRVVERSKNDGRGDV